MDDPESLRTVLRALARVHEQMPVLFPIHPRTRKNAERSGSTGCWGGSGWWSRWATARCSPLIDGAAVVLTDSGGLQEETTALGVPCVTLREQTERPITIKEGTNRLAPWPLTVGGVVAAALEGAGGAECRPGRRPKGWDGAAAVRIVERLAAATVSRRDHEAAIPAASSSASAWRCSPSTAP